MKPVRLRASPRLRRSGGTGRSRPAESRSASSSAGTFRRRRAAPEIAHTGELAAGAADVFFLRRAVFQQHVGNDEQLRKIQLLHGLQRGAGGFVLARAGATCSLQRLADALVRRGRLPATPLTSSRRALRVSQLLPWQPHRSARRRLVGPVHVVEDERCGSSSPLAVRHGLPDLIAGEGEDRGEHLCHASRIRYRAVWALRRLRPFFSSQ